MAVVHFATGGPVPMEPWTVPGGISPLDVPDRIVGRGRRILRRATCTPAQPVKKQDQKTSETNGNEGEKRHVMGKASACVPGLPWPLPPGDCPCAQVSPETPPPLLRTT